MHLQGYTFTFVSLETCNRIHIVPFTFSIISLTFGDMILAIRVYALFQKQRWISGFFAVLLTVLVSTAIWSVSDNSALPLPPDERGCISVPSESFSTMHLRLLRRRQARIWQSTPTCHGRSAASTMDALFCCPATGSGSSVRSAAHRRCSSCKLVASLRSPADTPILKHLGRRLDLLRAGVLHQARHPAQLSPQPRQSESHSAGRCLHRKHHVRPSAFQHARL